MTFYSLNVLVSGKVRLVDISVLLPALLVLLLLLLLLLMLMMMKMVAWCSYDDEAANQYCMPSQMQLPTVHPRWLLTWHILFLVLRLIDFCVVLFKKFCFDTVSVNSQYGRLRVTFLLFSNSVTYLLLGESERLAADLFAWLLFLLFVSYFQFTIIVVIISNDCSVLCIIFVWYFCNFITYFIRRSPIVVRVT